MSRLGEVRLIPRTRLTDQRGWFLKVIHGDEPGLPVATGEVYVTLALPGESRGHHYHAATAEWFTVVAGRAILTLTDPIGGEQRCIVLDAERPTTVFVPKGIGHTFTNPADADEPMMLVAYADRPYDPTDTIPLDTAP